MLSCVLYIRTIVLYRRRKMCTSNNVFCGGWAAGRVTRVGGGREYRGTRRGKEVHPILFWSLFFFCVTFHTALQGFEMVSGG